MRNAPKIVAATFSTALALPMAALAQAPPPVNLNATVAVDLNLRAGPAPTFPIVRVIPANETVIIYGCVAGQQWCDVGWGPNRGWSYSAYLIYQQTPVPQVAQGLPPPVVFEGEAYWAQNYQAQPFYVERNRWLGGAAGAGAGAAVGALVFGPIGAAVGAAVGGAFGAAITPPTEVVAFVQAQQPQPVILDGEVVIGASVPQVVTLLPVPNYQYSYANINGQWVLVDPTSRQIVYVIR